jgi:hypothetical protein
MACWDLRVQPVPAVPPAGGRGRGGESEGREGGAGQPQEQQEQSPFGAGCGGGGGGFGGGRGFGGGGGVPGPFVLPGTYHVSLIVDGTAIESKPLRVLGDPEVVLTSAERRKMFDLAMEMHDLQRRAADVGRVLGPISQQLPAIAKTVASRTDIPADVKASFEAFNKELTAAAQRFAAGAGGGGRGGRGGGRGGGGDDQPNPIARIGAAKNGLMGGMYPTAQTMDAYTEAKAQAPKAIADGQTLVAKAVAMSAALAKHNITLKVPPRAGQSVTSPSTER